MKKNPFLNCGKKIKKFVVSLYKLLILLSIGAGVAMVIAGISEGGPEEAIFWIGIAVSIILPIIVHISCLFLYGFGEIVENAERQLDSTASASNEIPEL